MVGGKHEESKQKVTKVVPLCKNGEKKNLREANRKSLKLFLEM